jgi:hypothetical protein
MGSGIHRAAACRGTVRSPVASLRFLKAHEGAGLSWQPPAAILAILPQPDMEAGSVKNPAAMVASAGMPSEACTVYRIARGRHHDLDHAQHKPALWRKLAERKGVEQRRLRLDCGNLALANRHSKIGGMGHHPGGCKSHFVEAG